MAKRLIDDYNNEYEDIKENLQKDVLTIGITGPFEKQHIPFIVRSFKKIMMFLLILKRLIY